MTNKFADFKEALSSEIVDFIEINAQKISITEINQLIVDLPVLRERFARIPSHAFPGLTNQLRFLSLVVEDQFVRHHVGQMVGEAAFALLYFHRETDLIPDSIPGMGLLDDAMVVRLVLGRHEQTFKSTSHLYQLSWCATSFDLDQLLSVVSPLRLTSFYKSLAARPDSTGPNRRSTFFSFDTDRA